MLQQVTAEVQPRLAAQVNSAVSPDRMRMVYVTFSHQFFCHWYARVWQSTFHIYTCSWRSYRPARYLSSSTHSQISKRCVATALRWVSSSITTGHYVLKKDVDPKRLGSENNVTKEAQAQTWWQRRYILVGQQHLQEEQAVYFLSWRKA